jgi:hypothetical protein
MEDLWKSIFTPGPTSSIIIATNASFAALQVILFCLLIATYSIHFVILSVLCACLWWAINWFVAELKIAQENETEKKAADRDTPAVQDHDSDTDATEAQPIVEVGQTGYSRSMEVETQPGASGLVARGSKAAGSAGLSDRSRSEISTEDEWEKISENEKDK